MADVVIPLGTETASDNLELRLLLRSLDKYASNIGQVWLVTQRAPKWLKNVNVLPCDDPHKHNKDANIIRKVMTAVKHPDMANNFIFASDDQLLTKPLDLDKAPVVYNNRGPKEIMNMPNPNNWHKRLMNTFRILKEKGHELTCNYESHTFQPMIKSNFLSVFSEIPYEKDPGVTINTAYYGLLGYPPMVFQDTVKVTFETEKIAIPKELKLYVGYNDKAFTRGLAYFLLGYFFGKSRYEV